MTDVVYQEDIMPSCDDNTSKQKQDTTNHSPAKDLNRGFLCTGSASRSVVYVCVAHGKMLRKSQYICDPMMEQFCMFCAG